MKRISRPLVELFDLVPFVSRLVASPTRFHLLGTLHRSKRVEARLYREIEKASSTDERDIAGTLGLSPTDKKYRETRAHLKSALLDHLFFLDLSRGNYSRYSQQLYALKLSSLRASLAATFVGSGLGAALAQKALGIALELEEWSSALDMLTILRDRSSLAGEADEHATFVVQQRTALEQLHALEEARICVEQAYLVFANSGAEHPIVAQTLSNAIMQLEPIYQQHESYKIGEMLFRLCRLRSQASRDYVEAIRVSDEQDKLLDRYPQFQNHSRRSESAMARFTSSIQLRDYTLATRARAQCETLVTSGDDNWYYFKEWDFILLMHVGKFEEAYLCCHHVMRSKRFEAQTEPQTDKWNLFLLYAEFFTGRRLPGESDRNGKHPVEVARGLLRLYPSFKGDHEGYRVATIALQVLILLRQGDLSALVELMESLAEYRSRHLRKDESNQSSLFVKLLALIPRLAQDPDKSKVKAALILAKMSSIKEIDSIQAQQVLPYEKLWSSMLHELTRNPSGTYRPTHSYRAN